MPVLFVQILIDQPAPDEQLGRGKPISCSFEINHANSFCKVISVYLAGISKGITTKREHRTEKYFGKLSREKKVLV